MSNLEVIHAYRKLLRAGLRAIQFSKPARYAVTEKLREAFRDEDGVFNPVGIRRTVWFLNAAATERGLEHKILKNLLHVHWQRYHDSSRRRAWAAVLTEKDRKKKPPPDPIRETAYQHYETTIAMLNDSMGLCLR